MEKTEYPELDNRPRTLADLVENALMLEPHTVGFRYPNAKDVWMDVTNADMHAWLQRIAAGFLSLGIEYEQRVAIAARTRIEWVIADLALSWIGAVTTAIYPNTNVDEVGYILEHSDSVVAVVENEAMLDKVRETGVELAAIICMDGEQSGDNVYGWDTFEKAGAAYLAEHPRCVDDARAKTGPETLATLIYTSGTTGRPKGVELTHDNWIWDAVAFTIPQLQVRGDVHFLWLPMSHAFGKDLVTIAIHQGAQLCVDGRVDKIVENLSILNPTVVCAAPRIFEKIRAAVMTAAPRRGVKGRIARWAFATGKKTVPYRLAGNRLPRKLATQYALADRLVFSKLRAKTGNAKVFISGSAKLSPQVQEWFYAAGIPVMEGYGLTECSAIGFMDHYKSLHFGTVGTRAPGSEVRIADDGEILIKGGHVFRGYHKDPEQTAEVLVDGWLHTGDIGTLSDDGYLTITDRKKDLIKTSGGKYVSPSEVEAAIGANIPYISQAVVAGDGRKYVSALITLDRPMLELWAKKRGINKPYEELTQLPEIHRSIGRYMDRANTKLERWEQVKRFAILDHELTQEMGNLTANQKIRRRHVLDKYVDVIDSLYDKDLPEDKV